jgi:hypothetical protein
VKPLSTVSEKTTKKDGCGKMIDAGKLFILNYMG